MTPIVQHNGQPAVDLKTLWYTGTDTVAEGQPLVYDMAAPVDTTFATEGCLGTAVCKPKSGSIRLAAIALANTPPLGDVTARFLPCSRRIPGEFDSVMVKANCTAGTTILTVKADGSVTNALVAYTPTTQTATRCPKVMSSTPWLCKL